MGWARMCDFDEIIHQVEKLLPAGKLIDEPFRHDRRDAVLTGLNIFLGDCDEFSVLRSIPQDDAVTLIIVNKAGVSLLFLCQDADRFKALANDL